ncbi:hypothetical protein [Pseudomonas granadensis]|uniref:hypothetical protein n=1 Tax=Pseudomonas granadensis TaxID=1421430 RepID=UPI0008794F57|nr:hypothetical protein [Pseudomonas granadensis]SDT63250.1 hypothetical protein SAMN05216579_5075 [Pseudomonas granadensis]
MGELTAMVDGKERIYPALDLYIIEDFKEISAEFGVRNEVEKLEDSVSLKNGEFPLVSYKFDGASIPWESGGTLTVNYNETSRRYDGSFRAEFDADGIPKKVTGDFKIWEDQ